MEAKRWIMALGLAGLTLMTAACDGSKEHTIKESSMVRGTTAFPSVLLFSCDDGNTYETRSRSYGGSAYRFSLSLPRDSVCRLWIKREGSSLRPVTFRDYRGNLSPLIYLKDPRVDLGDLSVDRENSLVRIVNDDVMLVASSDKTDPLKNSTVEVCLGKVDLIYNRYKL